jgi:hypothetical protein
VESGWYKDDVESQLGELYDSLWRARRLVVDTGIHAKHWTRQQAIDYGIEASEVERYVVFPGQACSYMIGQLKIPELRDKAKQTLGAKFLLSEFHNPVLSTGTVPLEILEQQVNAWIKTVSARPVAALPQGLAPVASAAANAPEVAAAVVPRAKSYDITSRINGQTYRMIVSTPFMADPARSR